MFLSEVPSHDFASACWTILGKNRSSFLEVLSEKDALKILILVLKNDNEGTLV